MSDEAVYASPDLRRERHAQHLQEGKVLLVLGSGVSQSVGLPNWDRLLDRLADDFEVGRQSGESNSALADRVRAVVRRQGANWNNAVHSALYRGKSLERLDLVRGGSLLAASSLAAFAAARPGGCDIVTFNYDDLVEEVVRLLGASAVPMVGPFAWSGAASARVWHPHGYLPRQQPAPSNDDVVLDRYTFAIAQSDLSSEWAETIRALFRRKYVIFIGVSGDDTNLDRFLAECSKLHTARTTSPYWGTAFDGPAPVEKHQFWKDRGVFLQSCADFDNDLPRQLLDILPSL